MKCTCLGASLLTGIVQLCFNSIQVAQAQSNPLPSLPSAESACYQPQQSVSRLLGAWGIAGEVNINARGQATISPNLFDNGLGVQVTIPFPTGIHASNFVLRGQFLNDQGDVAVTLSTTVFTDPDYLGIYHSKSNSTELAPIHSGILPAGIIKHYAVGISAQDELLVRSSDMNYLSEIYWLRATNGVPHLVQPPTGCSLQVLAGMNRNGVVAGACSLANGTFRGFVWSKTTGPQFLPTMGLPGETFLPRAIDMNGIVYGEVEYLDPSTAPDYLKLTVKVGATTPMSELPNSRVPAVFQPWNEGFVVRNVSPDGRRILGSRPAFYAGSQDILYLAEANGATLHDIASITPRIVSPTGFNAKFNPTSITNTQIGGVFADWAPGLFLPAVVSSMCE